MFSDLNLLTDINSYFKKGRKTRDHFYSIHNFEYELFLTRYQKMLIQIWKIQIKYNQNHQTHFYKFSIKALAV